MSSVRTTLAGRLGGNVLMRCDPRPDVGMTEEDGDDVSASGLVFRATVLVVLRMLRSGVSGDPLMRFERR
jgi:hypothetical protein